MKKLKKTTFFSHQLSIHVCDIVTSQILTGPVKMNDKNDNAQAGRARRHREKAGYFSYFDWYSG